MNTILILCTTIDMYFHAPQTAITVLWRSSLYRSGQKQSSLFGFQQLFHHLFGFHQPLIRLQQPSPPPPPPVRHTPLLPEPGDEFAVSEHGGHTVAGVVVVHVQSLVRTRRGHVDAGLVHRELAKEKWRNDWSDRSRRSRRSRRSDNNLFGVSKKNDTLLLFTTIVTCLWYSETKH